MSQSVVVYQPCYFPKLHYIARIDDADVFIVFDDVEFSRRSRQHRCQIDFASKKWLTIPVKHTGQEILIKDAIIDNSGRWHTEHYQTLVHKYGSDASRFETYYEAIKDVDEPRLVDVTVPTLVELLDAFSVDVEILRSSELDVEHPGDATTYIRNLVESVDGDEYICGKRAYENYLRDEEFDKHDIRIEIQNWEPKWEDGNVCALDVLFNAAEPSEYLDDGGNSK